MGVYVTDQTKKGWLTSILELGAWFGTLYSGFLAEVLSRKYAILVNVTIFIIGVIVQATAVSGGSSSILGGRFITGMPLARPQLDFWVTKECRYGCRLPLDDCAHVQRRDCST